MPKLSINNKINLSLFSFMVLLFPVRIFAQATETLYPVNAHNGSGYVNSANANTSGDILTLKEAGNRGYITFDLSVLPNGAQITSATLTLNVAPPSPTNIEISGTNIPGAVTRVFKNSSLANVTFDEINNGSNLGDITFDGSPGAKVVNLNGPGITALNNSLGGTICLGLRPPLNNSGGAYGLIGGYNSADPTAAKPELKITYLPADQQKPKPDFYAESASVRIDSIAKFFDNSGNSPTAWAWNFGDGNTSTLQNPTHQYSAVGMYTVSLKVTNSIGDSTVTKINYMEIREIPVAPVADFIADNVNPLVNTEVQFWDSTDNQVTQWEWDFGDGNFGYEQNPINTYASVGTYTVRLIAYGPGGNDTITKENYITVLGQLMTPVAAYGYVTDNLQVNFSDSSQNAPATLEWDFDADNNPGLYVSNEKNPSFTYASPGTYKVCLTATNAAGTDTHCKDITVQTASAPVANFSSSANGLSVTFTDFSTNSPTSWSWTFGDTQTSTLQHPAHTYASGGNYTVCLNASNAIGSDSKCKTISIVAMGVSSENAGISLFPNPASEKVFILANGLDLNKTRITMLNVLGETIVPVVSRNGDLLELNIEGLESGIYFIRAEDGFADFKQKISIY